MLTSFLVSFAVLIGYFVACAVTAVIIRHFVPVHEEVFRKTLHLILLGSLPIFLYGFEFWWMSAGGSLLFAALVYPALALAERWDGYSDLLTERSDGEVKKSLILVFGMYAFMITISWGWAGEPWLALASIYAWGFGDAAAALVGKKFGKHHLEGGTIEGRKSVEGTAAMFVVAFVTVLLILVWNASLTPVGYFVVPLMAAAATSVTELFTPGGNDTVTCPLVAAAVIFPLTHLLAA